MPLPKIDTLPALDRSSLEQAWRELVGTPAPARMSQTLMRRVIAFEIQALAQGGLSKSLLKSITAAATPASKSTPRLKPGGRLLREWNGTTHVVDVTEGGFIWNGQTYRSLSAIARAITGAHWSGPRFFGFTKGLGK